MAYIYMLRQLWRYAGEERWKIVVYYLLHTISVGGELGKPYAFAMVLNALQANRPTIINEVTHWLVFYIACVLIFEVFHRSARYIELPVAFRCRRRFVDAMYDRLQSLPLSWHTEHHSGNLIDRINVAAEALHEFGNGQMNYVAVIVKFWGPLIILWSISPHISAAALVVGVLMVVMSRMQYNSIVPLYRAQLEGFHDFAAAFFDYMSNVKTIITLRLGRYVKQDLDDRLARVFPFIMREHNVTQAKCASVALLTVALEVGVIFYYILGRKQAGAVIMAGSVAAIFQYIGQLMEAFRFYAGDYENIIHWQADLQAVNPVLMAEGQRPQGQSERLGQWNEIRVHPVRFSYGDGKLHLDDVGVRLRKNRKIALVGESGSGKSTLLQVLRGLTEIPDGFLTADGLKMPLSVLSGTATLIPQEPEIFENTIRHNVTLGIPADDEKVEAAVRIAAFDQVVQGLPNGLESDIREKGVNLSGGEK